MKVTIHASGSSGNCVTIDDFIMIDAGVEVKKDVKHLLLTHHHTDHTKALPKYAGVLTYASQGTIDKLSMRNPFCAFNVLNTITPLVLESGDDVYMVTTVALRHDAPCIGFDISHSNGVQGVSERIFYATDFNEILDDINVSDYDAIYIECNNTLAPTNMTEVFFGGDIPKDEFHRRKSFSNHCNVNYLINLFRRAGYSEDKPYPNPVILLHKSTYYYTANIERIVELCKIANVQNPLL